MSFLEAEMLPNLEGWQSWVGGGILFLARERADSFMDPYLNHSLIKSFGIVTDNGLIDIDKAYKAITAGGEKAMKPIYLNLGPFGEFTVTKKDLDRLYNQLRKLPQESPPPTPDPEA